MVNAEQTSRTRAIARVLALSFKMFPEVLICCSPLLTIKAKPQRDVWQMRSIILTTGKPVPVVKVLIADAPIQSAVEPIAEPKIRRLERKWVGRHQLS